MNFGANFETKATVDANVKLKPWGSQVVLFSCVAAAAASILAGAILVGMKIDNGLWFLAAGCALIFLTILAWRKSQSDSDMGNAVPTHIQLPNGTSVVMDSRNSRLSEGKSGLLEVLCHLAPVHPLPQADGLVDKNHTLLPNSEEAAAERVAAINSDAEKIVESLQGKVDHFQVPPPSASVQYPTPRE